LLNLAERYNKAIAKSTGNPLTSSLPASLPPTFLLFTSLPPIFKLLIFLQPTFLKNLIIIILLFFLESKLIKLLYKIFSIK